MTRTFDLVQFQDAVYDWIKTQTEGVIPEEQILWRNQAETLPPRPCVTMKIIDGPKPVGRDENLLQGAGRKIVVGGQREITVSIQIFGNASLHKPMALQMASDLQDSLGLPTVKDRLRKRGIAIQDRGDPQNLTALEETQYEERAGFDVLFGVAQNVIDSPGVIDHVHGSGEISGSQPVDPETVPFSDT